MRGRVVRVEDYGAFVQLGCGRQGLLHVSNMAHDLVEDPREVVSPGESIEAIVLHVRGGRRIALGLKQPVESLFSRLARTAFGQLVEGVVERFIAQGALVRVEPGVTGLLPEGQGPTSSALRTVLKIGEQRSLRILQLDPEAERLTLSLLHADGRTIAREEAHSALPRGPGGGARSRAAGDEPRQAAPARWTECPRPSRARALGHRALGPNRSVPFEAARLAERQSSSSSSSTGEARAVGVLGPGHPRQRRISSLRMVTRCGRGGAPCAARPHASHATDGRR